MIWILVNRSSWYCTKHIYSIIYGNTHIVYNIQALAFIKCCYFVKSISLHLFLPYILLTYTFLGYLYTITRSFHFPLYNVCRKQVYLTTKRQVTPVISLNASLSMSNSSRKYVASDKIHLYPGIERKPGLELECVQRINIQS